MAVKRASSAVFQRQHPRQRGGTLVAREHDQCGGDGRGGHKGDDGEKLAGDAVVAGNEFGAGDDEAAGDLGGEQAEQREIGVAVDIARDETEQKWHGSRQRRFALHGGVGHGGVSKRRHSGLPLWRQVRNP